jgi:hypothetical protein
MRLEIAGRRVGRRRRCSPSPKSAEPRRVATAPSRWWTRPRPRRERLKLQTIDADRLVSRHSPAPAHVKVDSLRDFFRTFELNWDAHQAVARRARQLGLAVMTTPFFEEAIPVLESIGFDAFKIASGDLTYDGLIAAAARTGTPVVLSTGMATLDEARRAVEVARGPARRRRAALRVSVPTPLHDENRRDSDARRRVRRARGLSDHGRGLASAVAAVALGADLYERRFMLADDRDAIDLAGRARPKTLRASSGRCATPRGARRRVKSSRPSEAESAPEPAGSTPCARSPPGVVRAGTSSPSGPAPLAPPRAIRRCDAGTRLAGGSLPRPIWPLANGREAAHDADERTVTAASRRVPLIQAFQAAIDTLDFRAASLPPTSAPTRRCTSPASRAAGHRRRLHRGAARHLPAERVSWWFRPSTMNHGRQ